MRDSCLLFCRADATKGPTSAGASTTSAADSNTSRRVTCMSEHFVNRIDRSGRPSIATGHGHQPIERRVRGMRGFEPDRGSKVVPIRIDVFAAAESRHHVRWSVAQAKGTHRDQCTVVGSECGPEVELEDAVRSNEQPVRATAGQDDAAEPTIEGPAGQRHRPAGAAGDGPNLLRGSDLHPQLHQQARVHGDGTSYAGHSGSAARVESTVLSAFTLPWQLHAMRRRRSIGRWYRSRPRQLWWRVVERTQTIQICSSVRSFSLAVIVTRPASESACILRIS